MDFIKYNPKAIIKFQVLKAPTDVSNINRCQRNKAKLHIIFLVLFFFPIGETAMGKAIQILKKKKKCYSVFRIWKST